MKKLSLLIGCLGVILTGCIAPPSEDGSRLTKEEAKRVQKGDARDLCEAYGWYGDGICDEFCPNTDPDCAVNCLAIPVCADDEIEVESCEGLEDCEENSMCGVTIYCAEDQISSCLAYPSCQAGYVEVETCPADVSCVEETLCGSTILCMDTVQCAAIPVCPEGYEEVQACSYNDPNLGDCHEVTECGATILCEQPIYQCEAYPVCPEGTLEVDGCDPNVDPTTCTEHSICGHTIYCQEGTINCLAYPVCPAGYREVQNCSAPSGCHTETMCGVTIQCEELSGNECVTDADCFRTGCSGQICAAQQIATTCEYLPEYACYDAPTTSCGCNSEGLCGFAQTDALAACLGQDSP